VTPVFFVGAALVAVRQRLSIDAPAFTSVFQGSVRFNSYVGVTAAVGLFGAHAAALSAIAIATIVPTVNVLCVLVFARYVAAGSGTRNAVRSIALNPLVGACIAGLFLHATGLGLPPGIEGFMKALGQAALPLGLLCVGAALDPGALGERPRLALLAGTAKFVAMPLVAVACCLALDMRGTPALIAILFNALPTASSSYVMARLLGGDASLMASLIASQTVVAALTMPLTLLAAQAAFD
jgi:predicted permease